MSDIVRDRGLLDLGDRCLEWRRIERASPAIAVTPASPAAAERPTLVLLHEGLGCVALWRAFPDALVRATGLPAFLYSRTGYGRSSPAPRSLPLDYHRIEALEVLPRVLDAAGIRRPILVGHSDGGTMALIHAAVAASSPPLAVVTMAAHVFNEETTLRGIVEAREAFTQTDLRARLSVYHGDNVDGAFWGWCETWLGPAFRTWNVESDLPAISCPVLVIQGQQDHYGTEAQVHAIAGQVSGPAEILMIADCGHAPHLEQPVQTWTAIASFLLDHNIV